MICWLSVRKKLSASLTFSSAWLHNNAQGSRRVIQIENWDYFLKWSSFYGTNLLKLLIIGANTNLH